MILESPNAMTHSVARVFVTLLLFIAMKVSAAEMPAGGEPKADPAAKPEGNVEAGEWVKVETKPMALATARQVLSPGFFDHSIQHMVVFPKDPKDPKDAIVEIGLPRGGKDATGKDYPPLKAKLNGDFIWVDLNCDGKPTGDEAKRIQPDGVSDPFVCELLYDDGTTAQYSFRFKTVIEKEKYALIRSSARTATFQNHRIVLLDDDGNGKYNDIDRDAVIIDDNPVTFLGKYILLGEDFYEILVHKAGASLELRTAPKLDTGVIDIFEAYTPSQKSETLRIHSIIVTGANGSFSFDERRRKVKAPAGSYDITFGLFERAKETVYMKKGEKTSFSVIAKETAKPQWGGEVTSKFDLSSDGQEVTVSPPSFIGGGSETYYPENYRAVPVTVTATQVYVDRMRIERFNGFGQKKFEVLPDGNLKPVEFRYHRNANDLYEFAVEYNSGIMGKVIGKERLQFVFKKKDPKDPAKDAKK
jgi:hypothetical protein